jgi:hypothetical protein
VNLPELRHVYPLSLPHVPSLEILPARATTGERTRRTRDEDFMLGDGGIIRDLHHEKSRGETLNTNTHRKQ